MNPKDRINDFPNRRPNGALSGPNMAFHRFTPKTVDLAFYVTGGGDAPVSGSIGFRVPTPDARCRTKITLMLVSQTANPMAASDVGTHSVWMCYREFSPSKGGRVPVRNLAGTRAAPLAIPTDAGLWGYEDEIETVGDEIYGILNAGDRALPGTSVARWQLCVRYAAIDPMSDAEWSNVLQKANPTAAGNPLVLNLEP